MTDQGLSVERLHFAYAAPAPVLADVTLNIARGSLVGILGPNGSGKTTLLRCLGGLLTPASGRVMLDGIDVRSVKRQQLARRVAMVPQETHLAFEYTVLEMAVMGRYPHLGAFEIEGPEEIDIARDALRATGTLHLADRLFNTLSGGEKQRVVIASALAQLTRTHPPGLKTRPTDEGDDHCVLLLDEPTASLDLAYQLEIKSIIAELNSRPGFTVVISTHDLTLAAALCRELVLLDRGHVLAYGPADEVLDPSLIRQLYGVEVDISTNARTGARTIIATRRAEGART